MVTSSYNALHQHLKLATAAAHSSLECVLAKRGYFDGREQYIQYLQRFLAFQEEAERALDLAVTAETVPDWHQRRRANLARTDLATLGAQERAFPGSSGRLPFVASCEQVLGMVYVLEGSTLGGAYLLKQLAPLGITATHGGSYLASYGSDRGKMWQRFLFTLEEAHLRQVQAESIAAAAIATFAAARYYLTEAEPVGAVSAARACSMVA
jgi:heme oxygenase (biliverdin-IX-beta and delta-forming)